MLPRGLNPSLFLLLLVATVFCVFFFIPFSPTRSTNVLHSHNLRFPEVVGGVGENGELVVTRRDLAEETSFNSSLILAANRTRRKNPLDQFKIYTQGYNISNKNYWASVGFTAAPFFVIAGVWFVLFGICLVFICLCRCCCPRDPYGYSRTCYAISLILLILFTVAAIVGCAILYAGQGKFHSITTHSLEYVVNQANVTAENLSNVSDYLAAARNIGVGSAFLPPGVKNSIDTIETKINSSTTILSGRTQENANEIHGGLNKVGMALVIIAAVMLALVFLGFLFSILGLQCLVYFLVILGWILVAGTFILCGVFLLLHNVVADTCISMDQWVQFPTAKTALDDIIPCVDNATAQETLQQTKTVTYQLVNMVDGIIGNLSNRNFPPQAGSLYYNQSGPLMPLLCNPFNPDLTDRKCAPGEVDLTNASQVWRSYTCQVSPSGICVTPGRVTPSLYNQMASSVNLSYGLYHYGPFLVDLQDCTFVRQTFTTITTSYCPHLRQYTQWVYSGLVVVSTAVMLSLIFWVIYARERRHRVYTKQRTFAP